MQRYCSYTLHDILIRINNFHYQIKNDKPKKPRAKRRPEKVKKITKEKEIEEKDDGDDEIARVLSTVKSKTKECFRILFMNDKVECIFQIVISSESRTGQYSHDDHREDALQFTGKYFSESYETQ